MAILLDESETVACAEALATDDRIVISAVTVAAGRRGLGSEMARLIDGLALEVVSVSSAVAERVAGIHAQRGRGVHPAGLNLGDCFAYEVAKTRDCPLLYVGADFARTDIASTTRK